MCCICDPLLDKERVNYKFKFHRVNLHLYLSQVGLETLTVLLSPQRLPELLSVSSILCFSYYKRL